MLFDALLHRHAVPALPNRLRARLAEDGASEDLEFGEGTVGIGGVGGHDV